MNIKDVWIGDWVEIISNQTKGTFEGQDKEGNARIKVDGKIMITQLFNIRITEEPNEKPELVFEEEEIEEIEEPTTTKPFEQVEYSIDLHINKLNPEFEPSYSETILEYQFKSFMQYFESAIANKMDSVLIIHGKGTGALKKNIHDFVKYHKYVFSHTTIHNGGAMEIVFNYR